MSKPLDDAIHESKRHAAGLHVRNRKSVEPSIRMFVLRVGHEQDAGRMESVSSQARELRRIDGAARYVCRLRFVA